jgi:hypothetical protein
VQTRLEPWPTGYGAAMECSFCLQRPADGALVRSVNSSYVCTRCAARIAACERAAATPLVVAGLAAFFEEWQESPDDASSTGRAARRFWSELSSFEGLAGSIDVLRALAVLASAAPGRVDAALEPSRVRD